MDDTDYTVEKPDRIAGILKDLDHKLTVVSVRVDTDGPLYTSALVRLDPSSKELFLDELTPRKAHQQVNAGTELRIYAALRGVAVRFGTCVTRIEQEQKGALYVCTYPETLHYLQRRETFRVHIPMAQRPQIELHAKAWKDPVIGEVADLSAQGMCIELSTDLLDALEEQANLAFENLLLPDVRERLSGELRLANRRRSTRDGFEFAGFEIVGMTQWMERQTNIALLHYQREARRRSMD